MMRWSLLPLTLASLLFLGSTALAIPCPPTPRTPTARRIFQRQVPCPSTGLRRGACPGYVVDHIVPLMCGGADAPANMQWQTIEDAKRKDRWERKTCPPC